MAQYPLVVVVALATLAALCHCGSAQPLSKAAEDYLDAHNQARAAVGVAPLKWSAALETTVTKSAAYHSEKKDCGFASLYKLPWVPFAGYGVNLAQFNDVTGLVSPRDAVESWVSEKEYYNHADNSCAPKQNCTSYTQVVWSKSLELGCAEATCPKDKKSLTICIYSPPGNVLGESPY